MKKDRIKAFKITIFCNIIAIICFCIAGYGHFRKGETTSAIIWFALALSQITLVFLNIKNLKNIKKMDESEIPAGAFEKKNEEL